MYIYSSTACGWGLCDHGEVSFQQHIVRFLSDLTGLQWVNHGFASWFGLGDH